MGSDYRCVSQKLTQNFFEYLIAYLLLNSVMYFPVPRLDRATLGFNFASEKMTQRTNLVSSDGLGTESHCLEECQSGVCHPPLSSLPKAACLEDKALTVCQDFITQSVFVLYVSV